MPNPFRALTLAALLLSTPALAHAQDAAAPDTVPVARVGPTQALLAFTRGEAVMIDVRYPNQRRIGHIEGDVAMRFDQVADQHDRLPRDKKLIFYCSCAHEEEALEAARAMPNPREPRIAVLVGGFDAWMKVKGPIHSEATWSDVFMVSTRPGGWGKTPTEHGRCRYLRDSTVAARGRASGCVICARPESTATTMPGFSQRADATPLRGRTVMLSAMLRTDHLDGAALLWMGAENDQGRLMVFARSDSTPVTGTHAWKAVELRMMVPEEARLLDFGVHVLGDGRAWIDEVKLIAEPEGDRPRYRAVVDNEGFEE